MRNFINIVNLFESETNVQSLDEKASYVKNAREFGIWLTHKDWDRGMNEVLNYDYLDDDKGFALRYRLIIKPSYMDFLKEIMPEINAKGWHVTVVTKMNKRAWQVVFEPILTRHQPKLAQDNGVYWHITPASNVESILQNGLQPRDSRFGFNYPQKRVYLIKGQKHAEQMKTALGSRDKKPVDYVLLKVRLKGVKGATVHTDPELKDVAVYTTQPIPPSQISVET